MKYWKKKGWDGGATILTKWMSHTFCNFVWTYEIINLLEVNSASTILLLETFYSHFNVAVMKYLIWKYSKDIFGGFYESNTDPP